MKPRTDRPNPWMLRARAAKADRLVQEIHDITALLGVSKSAMLESVAHWGNREWASLSVRIGRRPPSGETVTAVLATLSRAALIERMDDGEPFHSSERDTRCLELVEP